MKHKTVILLLSAVFLGSLIAIFAATTGSRESASNTLPLNEVWTFQTDDRILSTPIEIDDQIILRTADKIYSISAVNGSLNWEIPARASDITINVNHLGKPIVGNSKFLISEERDNSVGIYSTKTGEELWTVEGQLNFINALEIVDDVMIVARHDGNLVVYDLTSHQKLWEVALPPRSPTPVAVNQNLVIIGMGDTLRVYGLKDGSLLNEITYNEALIIEIALSRSNIFVSVADDGNYSVYSLQVESLNENWVYNAGEEISHTYLSATMDQLSVFNQKLISLDANSGNVVWKDDSQQYYSAPAFHENNLFFISVHQMFSNNKELCKVEIREGAIKDCSLVESTGGLITSQGYLLGLLATNDLLIIPRGSDVVAFRMPSHLPLTLAVSLQRNHIAHFYEDFKPDHRLSHLWRNPASSFGVVVV